jgi:hypothetical protein
MQNIASGYPQPPPAPQPDFAALGRAASSRKVAAPHRKAGAAAAAAHSHPAPAAAAAAGYSRSPMAQARRLCTSEDCPMAAMLEAMPNLCELEPPKSEQREPTADDRILLQRYEAVRPYADSVWGPASWTALEADILSLPERLDAHEFCLFKIYLALRARYLSCSACALHFEKAIKAMPNDAVHRTRAGLLKWLCDVHNDVNRRKQREPLSQDAVLEALNAKAAVKAGAHASFGSASGARPYSPGTAAGAAAAAKCGCGARSLEGLGDDNSPASAAAALALPAAPSSVLVPAAVLAGILLLAALASAARMLWWSRRSSRPRSRPSPRG